MSPYLLTARGTESKENRAVMVTRRNEWHNTGRNERRKKENERKKMWHFIWSWPATNDNRSIIGGRKRMSENTPIESTVIVIFVNKYKYIILMDGYECWIGGCMMMYVGEK